MKLNTQLRMKSYKTSEYSVFKVYEPKEREIIPSAVLPLIELHIMQ